MNQILRRQTSRSHYGSKVPAVTVTVFKYRNKIKFILIAIDGRKIRRVVKRYGKYRGIISRIVKRHDKYVTKVGNSEMIWKIWKKSQLKCEMLWKIWKKGKSNSEKIWKIQKKIVK